MAVKPGDLDTNTQYLRSIDDKTSSQVAGSDTPVSGQKTVTTAGTAVAVGGDVAVKGLIVIDRYQFHF